MVTNLSFDIENRNQIDIENLPGIYKLHTNFLLEERKNVKLCAMKAHFTN
jgi:hypothetical protein